MRVNAAEVLPLLLLHFSGAGGGNRTLSRQVSEVVGGERVLVEVVDSLSVAADKQFPWVPLGSAPVDRARGDGLETT